MDTIEAIHSRRSIRAFGSRSVEQALLEALIWDAAQAPVPPASGARPFIFHVFTGAPRIAGYGERAKLYAAERRPPGAWKWTVDPAFQVFWGAPALVLISGPQANEEAAVDCARAGQNLSLSAHARGLGACWVGAPLLWLRDAEVKGELGIPAEFQPYAPFALGYSAALPPPRQPEPPLVIWAD